MYKEETGLFFFVRVKYYKAIVNNTLNQAK